MEPIAQGKRRGQLGESACVGFCQRNPHRTSFLTTAIIKMLYDGLVPQR
jgi:hypothetical protein